MLNKALTLKVLTTAALLLLPQTATSGRGYALESADAEPVPTSVRTSATSDWSSAPLLPAALAVASNEARRTAAQSGSLTPSSQGVVELSITNLIDLTLENNLDIRLSSYQPALSVEAVRQQEAIFDPLLRFTLALFSTTNPTAATLDGADVLSITSQDWNVSGQRLLPWGGTASAAFNNKRSKSNSRFATLNPSFDTDFTVQLTQPLLRNFGRDVTRRNIRIAQNDHKASSETFRLQVINTVNFSVNAYWDLYGKLQNLEVRRESVRLAEDLLKINRIRVKVGTLAPLEISTAEAEVARNEEQLIRAEDDVRGAQDTILQLINTPADSPLWGSALTPVDAPSIDDREFDIEAEIALAMDKRPELRRQEFAFDNEEIRLEFAKDQLRPGLSLQASWGLSGLGGSQIVQSGDPLQGEIETMTIDGGYGDAIDSLFGLDFDTWRLSATLDVPVFNQAAEASHASAHLNRSRSRDVLEQLQQNIAVEVRRLVRAAQTSRKSMDAAAVTRSLQEQRLDAEQKKFEHGLSTPFEVAQAQKDLTEARTSEVIASTTYRRALANLEAANGTVLESYGINIDEE